MILVTGSSGTIGSELLKELAVSGQTVRAGYCTRVPSTPGVQAMRIDLVTGEGLDAALDGADAVFLLMGEAQGQTDAEIRVVEAAKRAGVSRLVKLSVFGAETEAYSYARTHRPIERAVQASGIPYTLLRPVNLMQNFLNYYGDSIRNHDAFYVPGGDGYVSQVDARDIARVAAKTLTSDGHEGKAYDLAASELLSYGEAAARLSAVAGRTISYVNVSETDFRQSRIDQGVPAYFVDRLLDLYRFGREAQEPTTSTAIKDVTGRHPITFDQFAYDYADAWKAG